MILTLEDDGNSFHIGLGGDVRWNDRLALAALAGPLRSTRAMVLVLDGLHAHEADRGSFGGLAATARRMALLEGLVARIVPPGGIIGAAA